MTNQDFSRDLNANVNYGNGKIYFFKAAQYVRFAMVENKVDLGPKAISAGWRDMDPGFAQGLSAAVNYNNGRVYLFKGGKYVRYNMIEDRMDQGPREIADGWPGMPASFASGIDAAINYGNGLVYLFKGSQYLRFNMNTNRVDRGPVAIAEGWPGLPPTFNQGIDTVVNYNNGKVYLFKGNQYVRFDMPLNRMDQGPREISAGWPGM